MGDPAECEWYGFETPAAATKREAEAGGLDTEEDLCEKSEEATTVAAMKAAAKSNPSSGRSSSGGAASSSRQAPLPTPAAAAAGAKTDGTKRDLGEDCKEVTMPPPKAVRMNIREVIAGMVLPVACEEEEEEPVLDLAEFEGDYVDVITGLPLSDEEVERVMEV